MSDDRTFDVLTEAKRQAAGEAAEQVDSMFHYLCATHKITSPIEQLFLAAFLPLWHQDERFIGIRAQVPIGNYRADFVVTVRGDDRAPDVNAVVECDGHDFHERTKDQASRDKKRDRFLVSQGYLVIRFTGSELWADPFACAYEVFTTVSDLWWDRAEPRSANA